MTAKYDVGNPAALVRLVGAGAQLRGFSRPVMDACFKAAEELYVELGEKSPEFKKIHTAWSKFRDEQILWSRVCENNFDAFMAQAKTKKG